jgi:hypothetical protein
MINRSVLIVQAKEPFLAWIRSLPDPSDVSREQVNRDNTAYLLPEYSYDYEEGELIEQFYDLIFEEQLVDGGRRRTTGRQNETLQFLRSGSM